MTPEARDILRRFHERAVSTVDAPDFSLDTHLAAFAQAVELARLADEPLTVADAAAVLGMGQSMNGSEHLFTELKR
jgi:hypothetical protein